MKKLLTYIFVFIVFTTGILFAKDADFKNNLLKIDIKKMGENSYDIGLYTQKIYNEPVKVIKKSDNLYYLFLPETSHSITSVPPLGDITNISVKSYPYAGQDLNNAYTRISVVTSRPVEITTSLKTLDTSISPRLNPARLAKLDNVFERYSQRLANNNIPSPLNQFKAAAAKQPLQNVIAANPNQNTQNKVQTTPKTAKPNTQTKQTAASKPLIAAKPQSTPLNVQKQAAPSKTQLKVNPPKQNTQNATKPQTTAQKPVAVQKPKTVTKPVIASKPTQTPIQKKVETPKPQTVAQKLPAKANTESASAKTAPVKIAQGTVSPVSTPAIKKENTSNNNSTVASQAASKTAVSETNNSAKENNSTAASKEKSKAFEYEKQLPTTTPIETQFTVNPNNMEETTEEEQEQEPEPIPQAQTTTANNNQRPYLLLVVAMGLFVMYLAVRAINQKAKIEQINNAQAINPKNREEVKELLKSRMAKTKPPVLPEGGNEDTIPVQDEAALTEIFANQEEQYAGSEPQFSDYEEELQASDVEDLPPAADVMQEDSFAAMMSETPMNTETAKVSADTTPTQTVPEVSYQAPAPQNSAPKKPAESTSQSVLFAEDDVLKELYSPIDTADIDEGILNMGSDLSIDSDMLFAESPNVALNNSDIQLSHDLEHSISNGTDDFAADNSALNDLISNKVENNNSNDVVSDKSEDFAVNNAADSFSSDNLPVQDLISEDTDTLSSVNTYDDINTGIQTRPEENTYAQINADDLIQNDKSIAPQDDSDGATIVSSSKLSDTSGLYLAEFEGQTSLVGYINDDIYILYNFGQTKLSDTKIQSRLAQKGQKDNLYIVKTGGKKLMVKSTNKDMTLEMVM